ncbi:MAG: hypothetical protein H3C56_10915 [Chitinophagaceae bacterium]|nr:hypothetical protein [Chitinophagaceae bacterium]
MSDVNFQGTQEEWEALVLKNKIKTIAMACHEANRVWCMSNGDYSQKHWEEAEQSQQDSVIKGVEYRLSNPNSSYSALHNAWMQYKINNGWIYGVIKDVEKKTHPCIAPFEQLPIHQKKKDVLFCAIVDALK